MKEIRFTHPDLPPTIVVRVHPLTGQCAKCGAASTSWISIQSCFEDQEMSGYEAMWCEGCHPGAA